MGCLLLKSGGTSRTAKHHGRAFDETAERIGVQLPRARGTERLQKRTDRAREAVSWNAVLGGPGL